MLGEKFDLGVQEASGFQMTLLDIIKFLDQRTLPFNGELPPESLAGIVVEDWRCCIRRRC